MRFGLGAYQKSLRKDSFDLVLGRDTAAAVVPWTFPFLDQAERLNLYRSGRRVLSRQRHVRPFLREAVGTPMENIIVGVIALLLFVYLFVAMIRPEKF
jgi:K+-transporting ATPase KdpF subunit